jgi:hypothetical protein
MIRKLKTLGVALVAALALTAVSAASASAANYTAGAYPTTITGESALGNDTFTTEAGKVECKAHFQGTLAASSSSLEITPTYTNCRAFGFLEATVHMNGCKYLKTGPIGGPHTYQLNTDLVCPAGKDVTITSATCDTTIQPQTNISSITVTNVTASGDLTAKANLTGIKYTVVTDGFGCPYNGIGAKTGATYVQDAPITLDSTNGQTIDVG